MKIIKLILAAVIFTTCSLTNVFAADNSHREAAAELLTLTNPDNIMQQVWSQVGLMMDQQFEEMGAPEELKPIFKKYTDKIFKLMVEEYSFANMKEDLITVYVNTYSETEIRDISKFYKSAAGKKFIEKMPQLMQETMAITQKNMQGLMEKIQEISQEMAEEIKARSEKEQE